MREMNWKRKLQVGKIRNINIIKKGEKRKKVEKIEKIKQLKKIKLSDLKVQYLVALLVFYEK